MPSYPASFGDQVKTVDINQVTGSGEEAVWFVYIDRYYQGSVVFRNGELVYHPGPGLALQGDDVAALLEVMEEVHD